MNLDEERLARFARGAAMVPQPAEYRADAYARLFDLVQAVAFEQEAAGDFEDAPVLSTSRGPWTWRTWLAEKVEEPRREAASDLAALVSYA